MLVVVKNMSIIVKTYERDYHSIEIENEDGFFIIEFCPNLDLYWRYVLKNRSIREVDSCVFECGKGDELYNSFYRLYDSIISDMPYKYSELDFSKDERYRKVEEWNSAEAIELVKDDVITWISDDSDNGEPSKVSIEKLEDRIRITFYRNKPMFGRMGFFVRFRNSGSSYRPFNTSFMIHYRELLNKYKD